LVNAGLIVEEGDPQHSVEAQREKRTKCFLAKVL
jgi:ABC-type polar amino acid transport system ATPase subunit